MSLFNLANTQSAVPVDANAPMTQEQFVAQNPDAYSQENSNPSYDYMLYQMQQENAAKAQAEAQLKQSDPRAYAAQKAEEATGVLFNDFSTNGKTSALTPNLPQQVNESKAFLDSIKDSDPLAYWNAQLSLNLQKAGWDAGQGKVNEETNAKIQDALQNAQAAGLPQEQINNLIKINYEGMAKSHAENIAQRAGQGATLQGIEKVLPAFAAMITAGALAPAAGALEAGSAGATTVGEGATASTLPSLSWEASQIGALPASTGTFGSFTVPALGAEATGIGMTGAIPAGVMVGDGTLGTVIGATYQAAAPGQFALDALGNPIQATSVGIDGFAPTSGISAKDILTNANRLKNIAKAISSTGTKTAGTSSGTSAATQKALANALNQSSTGPTNFAAMNMNQNPYLQAQQVANIQSPLKQHDFLADLAQAGKTQPTMADILRTKEA